MPASTANKYFNPLPGGTVGRTDQGVDISAPPGTPILAITRERLTGIISNWFKGQPFLYFQELDASGQPTGEYNYAAEQITPSVTVGQEVQAGQQIGVVAPSGTALEFGYATAEGQTLARATTGYTEGEATPAGTDYLQNVIQGGGIVRPGGETAGSQSGNSQSLTTDGYSSDDGGAGVDQMFANYTALRDMPRTAPPGTKNPFQWFLASFTGNWDALNATTAGSPLSAAGTPSGTSTGAGNVNTDIPTPGGGYTPQTFAQALLQSLGAPTTPANVAAIVEWERREGGNWNNSARFNPLNTTQDAPGSTTFQSSGVGAAAIRIYTSWAQGLQATADTLNNGRYNDILAILKTGNASWSQLAATSGMHTWGTT